MKLEDRLKHTIPKTLHIKEEKTKSPRENLAINSLALELIEEEKTDLILRTYTHSNGIIIGKSQTINDLYPTNSQTQIAQRETGGAAVVVDPQTTFCYSIFFKQQNKRINPRQTYQKILEPLAELLDKRLSNYFTHYIGQYNSKNENRPLIGHSMKSQTATSGIQIDGIVHITPLTSSPLLKKIKLRKLLYEPTSKREFVTINQKHSPLFEIQPNRLTQLENTQQPKQLTLYRDEEEEISQFLTLQELGITTQQFEDRLRRGIETIFSNIRGEKTTLTQAYDTELFDSETISKLSQKYRPKKNGKQTLKGHCFIYYDEIERKNKPIY